MGNIELMIHQKRPEFFSHKLSLHCIIIMYHKSAKPPPQGGAYLFHAHLRERGVNRDRGLFERGGGAYFSFRNNDGISSP